MTRDILVVGATGQQGKSVIDALYASAPHSPPLRILALTRSVSSTKAQALQAAYPEIVLVEGDICDSEAIFAAHQAISAAFLVTVPPKDEQQALPFIEAAVAPGTNLDHIVFSSVDRGGDEASWSHPTDVSHFAAKHRIELRLRQLCDEAGKRWTILRPTGFMDNYNPGFFGKMMSSLWAAGMPTDRRIQMISTRDIGIFGAKALADPETWAGRALALAGDDVSFDEFRDIFNRVTGEEPPQMYGPVARAILWWVEDARKSFEWFRTAGYAADIASLRKQVPELQTLEQWLQESSRWRR